MAKNTQIIDNYTANLPNKDSVSGTEKIIVSDGGENKGVELSKVKEYAADGVATKEDLNSFIPNLLETSLIDKSSTYFPFCFYNTKLGKIGFYKLCELILSNGQKAIVNEYYSTDNSHPAYFPAGIKLANRREWKDIYFDNYTERIVFNSDISCGRAYFKRITASEYINTNSIQSTIQGTTKSSVFNAVGSITEVYNKTEIDDKLSAKADTTNVSATADGLMSKEDKVLFDKLKSVPALSHLNDDSSAFTATKTGVTLNYTCYDVSMWGGKGTPHNAPLPVASSTQAGIMTAADKVKVDSIDTIAATINHVTDTISSSYYSKTDVDKKLTEKADKTVATTTSDGLMSAADKKKLDSLSVKEQLFIDMWNSACGTYGKYNTETGFYELNGLTDITYEQALAIYVSTNGAKGSSLGGVFRGLKIRTHLPFQKWPGSSVGGVSASYIFAESDVEVVDMHGAQFSTGVMAFLNCPNLKSVVNLSCYYTNYNNYKDIFKGCVLLEDVRMNIYCDFSFSDSPLLTYTCIKSIISYSNNTSDITIIVHPTTYAYLQGTTAPTTQVGGTTEQWQALVTAATAKKISFATTE